MKDLPFYPGMDIGKMTNKQRKRAERQRQKDLRRRHRLEVEWKKQRKQARALPPRLAELPAARPPRMALAAGLAATVALVALDPYMRPKESL